ncbi:MAG: sigma 54-interacting transcriptional regulator [Firmicutes bacterium]|nr:sigma 54-interacting transcriptional regulator [Bacillota bacterium]
MLVKQVMSPNPLVLEENNTLQEAAQLFRRHRIEGAPVVDIKGKLVGILTKNHLFQAIIDQTPGETPVSTVMNPNVATICEDLPSEQAWMEKVGRLPVLDKNGELVGIITRTDMIAAYSQEIETANNRLNTILQSAYDAIIAVGKDSRIIIFNAAAEKILGIPGSVCIGKPVEQIIPGLAMEQTLISGEASTAQLFSHGSVVCIGNRSPIIEDGKINGAVAIFHEQSDYELVSRELRFTQGINEELEAIIESSYDGFFIVDEKGACLRINTAYTRITGLEPSQVVGQPMEDLVRQGHFSRCIPMNMLEKKKPVSIISRIKNGKKVLITGNPVFDQSDNLLWVVCNVRDLTELNWLKEELEHSQELTRRYSLELEQLRRNIQGINDVVVRSPAMQQVVELGLRVAQVDSTVLILGESGVGKEVIAKLIHSQSSRQDGPFIQVNCAAIPESLLESELFGYERGSFTGARQEGKPGMFELAQKGTIFLDEIGELPLNLQAKLLKVLQDKEVMRIGGSRQIKLDIRIICATNKNLGEMAKKGQFREDVYYRLNVFPIQIPPLRARKEDIGLLVYHFQERFNQKYGLNKRFSTEVIDLFCQYDWPGNIRELENVVERLMILVAESVIIPNHLPANMRSYLPGDSHVAVSQIMPLRNAVEEVEKQLLLRAIRNYRTTRKIAEVLGLSQPSVVRKLNKYRIVFTEGDQTIPGSGF